MAITKILIVALLLAISACATHQTTENASTEFNAQQSVLGEKLLAAPPTGWIRIYELNNGTTRLSDFVPPEQSKAEWSTKLSFESHESLTDIDPISIVMGDLQTTNDVCEPLQSFNLFSGEENNYPTTVRLTFCGKNAHNAKGEVTISKVIQGNDYLYIIKMINQTPPFTEADSAISKEEIAAWSQYFRDITLCDDNLDTHRCPTPSDE